MKKSKKAELREEFIKQVLIQTIRKDDEKVFLCSTPEETQKKLDKTLAIWTNEQNIALPEEWYKQVSEKCSCKGGWQPIAIEEIFFLRVGSIVSFTKEPLIKENGTIRHFSVILLAIDEVELKYRLGSSFGKLKAVNFKSYFWMKKLSEEDQKILYWKDSTLLLDEER
jgi:hypothetical protein